MANLTILVVDDDPVIRRLLEERLKKEQYNVLIAEDGHKAIQLLQRQRFDVVLTDLVMPDSPSGIEVLEEAKNLYPNTEVVLITAHSSVDTAVAAMKKGAADYLEKPINFDELLIRMDKIANLKKIMRNAHDIEEAMSVTEHEASLTIQDLEMKVSRLRDILDKVEAVLHDSDKSEDQKVTEAVEILSEN